jgi:DNA repair and recombination RAD54-like protein
VIDDENSSSDSEEDDENSSKDDHLSKNDVDELNLEPCNIQTTMSNDAKIDDRVSLGDYYSFGKEKLKRKRFHDSDDIDFESKWEGIHFKKGSQTKRHHSIFTSREHVGDEQDHKGGRSLNVDACKEMIDTYMKNFDSLPTEEEPTIMEETSKLEQKVEENVLKIEDEEEDPDDLAGLWEEMDTALISSNLLDGTEVCDNCLYFSLMLIYYQCKKNYIVNKS